VTGRIFASALCVAVGLTGAATAQQIESSYTDLDLNTMCTVIESDLRMFVSYGLHSTTEKAAEQTLGPFNRLGEKIEWRVSNAEGHWKPFATILRFFTEREDSEKAGQVLVVTKVATGATCHIAYVDALANPNANELAREAADKKAKDFDCDKDEPEYVGKFEAWER